MRLPGTVLILTRWFDPTADHVIEQLNARTIPVMRADTADFPRRASLTANLDGPGWNGEITAAGRRLDFGNVAGIYYRRPAAFEFPPGMTTAELSWARAEARIGVGGILATLPGWLNHPVQIAAAAYKPVQLARSYGWFGGRVRRWPAVSPVLVVAVLATSSG